MTLILHIFGTLGLAALLAVVWRGRAAVALTTLLAAWRWLAAAGALWTGAWVGTVLLSAVEPAVADQVWYLVAVLMLCPLVAVLGARIPVTRVWTWFVLLPLVLVLSLPLVTTWSDGTPYPRLELELPPTLGYLLVLVMGAGNYFGTRFTLPALLLAVALVLLVLPVTPLPGSDALPAESARVWATLLLAAAGLAVYRQGRQAAAPRQPFDRLWLDFRDYFGIVWAKRVQDRINLTAANDRWPVRLELHGLAPVGDADQGTLVESAPRVEHTFRWLFRRFAEPAWIDARLQDPPRQNSENRA